MKGFLVGQSSPSPRSSRRRRGDPPAITAPLAPATIIVIEDSEASRDALQWLLQGKGHEVLVAGSGAEAIRACQDHPGSIDVIIADLGLEDGPGDRAVEHIRARHPRAAVVYISGREAEDPIVKRALRCEGSVFLRKPFELEALLALLSLIISPARSRTGSSPAA